MATAGPSRRPRGATVVEPVFIMKRDIPAGLDPKFVELDICTEAERVSGLETIGSCQIQHGSMYRLYATNRTARATLLTSGITLNQTSITLYDKNPYILRDSPYNETPTTRVLIGEIPLSVADTDIETALTRVGCVLRSKLMEEHYRDRDNKLTRFGSGRRFIFISVPSRPLEKTLKIGGFTASVYHKEQKAERNVNRPCGRCLQPGHTRFTCQNDIVCRDCLLPGHMRGDDRCTAVSAAPAPPPPPPHAVHESQEPETHGQEATATAATATETGQADTDESSEAAETDSDGETDFSDAAESPAPMSANDPALTPAAIFDNAPPAPSVSTTDNEEEKKTDPISDPTQNPTSEPTQNPTSVPPEDNKETENKKKKKKKKKKEDAKKDEESRGRQLQTTLNFETRPRSQTPSTKRGREKDGDTPDRPEDKMMRAS